MCAIKKICIIVLSFCILQYLPVSAAQTELPYPSAETPSVAVDIPITDLYVGDAVYIEAKLNQSVPLYALEMEYTYDTTTLKYQKIEPSELFSSGSRELANEPVGGKGSYLITNVGEPSNQTTSELFTMTFLAKQTGKTTISLQNLTLVYQDLGYSQYTKDLSANITIYTKSTSNNTGGGGGGGNRPSDGVTGSIQVNLPSTSTTSAIPTASPVELDAEKERFSDLAETAWASEAINALADQGVLSGYEDGTFRPQNYLTRAELTKIIALAVQLPDSEGQISSFTDIEQDVWYTPYVYKAAENHLITGYEDQTFRPEAPVTREEFATILARAAAYQQYTLPAERLNVNFTDEAQISPYAVGYIDQLYMAGIINGDDTGTFRPQESLTRAEASVGIWQYLQITQGSEGEDE